MYDKLKVFLEKLCEDQEPAGSEFIRTVAGRLLLMRFGRYGHCLKECDRLQYRQLAYDRLTNLSQLCLHLQIGKRGYLQCYLYNTYHR